MAIRDFNAILSANEKTSRLSPGKRCPHFGEFVDSTDLFDLSFRRSPFTWHQGNLFERLDKALGNEAWVRNFPNSLITHLSKIKSDHRPFLLVLKLEAALPRGRAFRFLVRWVEHPIFRDFIKDKWALESL